VEVENAPETLRAGGDFVLRTAHGKELQQAGARWSAKLGAWTLPATQMHAQMVDDMDLGLPSLRASLVVAEGSVDDDRLYPFQREAAGRLAVSPHGLLVCLSPGLGKTAVAIAAADACMTDQVVVVAPASLLRTWEREIHKWSKTHCEVYVARGSMDYEAAGRARWIVTSWEWMTRHEKEFGKGWPVWVLDESVLVKSRGSARFKALDRLRKGIGRVWLLSGNPTTRYADDLWAQLHLIWPRAFASYWRFAERYTVVEDTPWGKSITASRAGMNAARDNADLMLVVNQEDVLDLPEYLFEVIDVGLTVPQALAYGTMKKEFVAELENGTEVIAANEVAKLMKLQQIVSCWDGHSSKRDALVELIKTYEAPYLVWTHFRATAVDLFTHLAAAGVDVRFVTGETPQEDRDEILERFKNGGLDCLILSLGVGKFGHTFTIAKTVFYIDKTWAADDYFQSLHRVRRIGLKHRPVVVTIHAPHTTDDLVEDNLEGKLGGISKMTKAHLATLLKGLGR